MTVRAKFYVGKLENPEGAAAAQVGLNAVCRGVENALWAQATPCGSITMSVKNDPAFEQFEYGAEYEVTFRKVAKPAAGDGHPIKPAENMHNGVVCETCGAHLYTIADPEKPWTQGHDEGSETHQRALALHEEIYGTEAQSSV